MPAAARTMCASACRFITTEDLAAFHLAQDAGKGRRLAETLSLVGILHKNFVERLERENRLPFAQGILTRIRQAGFAQRVIQIATDKNHQFRVLPDFFRNKSVELQTAPINEIVPHVGKNKRPDGPKQNPSWAESSAGTMTGCIRRSRSPSWSPCFQVEKMVRWQRSGFARLPSGSHQFIWSVCFEGIFPSGFCRRWNKRKSPPFWCHHRNP